MTENIRLRPAIIGLPFDHNSSYMTGAAEAPPLIRQALHSDAYHLWTETGVNLGAEGMLHDAGDVKAANEEMNVAIQSAISGLLDRQLLPLSLGGDHAVTFPIIRAFAKEDPRLNILHFDADSDIY